MTRPLVVAHRGDHREAPENSLAAFQAAIAAGADGIELDVRASADGQAIVLHDETLIRVQRVDARADRLTAAKLGRLGVPRLADVLDLLPAELLLDVELKEPVVEAVRAAVRHARGDRAPELVVSSFDEGTLALVAEVEPGWPRWLIDRSAAGVARASAMGCAGVALEWRAVDEATVEAAHRASLLVMAWTVRDGTTARRLAALGVDAICAEGRALGQRRGRESGGSSH